MGVAELILSVPSGLVLLAHSFVLIRPPPPPEHLPQRLWCRCPCQAELDVIGNITEKSLDIPLPPTSPSLFSYFAFVVPSEAACCEPEKNFAQGIAL